MPSLFVESDEPLLVFPSIAVAESWLEAVDVNSRLYPRAFDATGQQFSIIAIDDMVTINKIDAPPDVEGLKDLLRRALAQVGDVRSDDASIDELVAAAEAFWQELDPYGERFSKPIPWWCLILIAIPVAGLAVYASL
ncbi:hypothetical protein [uncultured Sphingomonas sp.]|uniref:hypothetical protein n=1 Tax=uncultured Sphingomonas sp. TaxID=158754 RepID=UPI003749254D